MGQNKKSTTLGGIFCLAILLFAGPAKAETLDIEQSQYAVYSIPGNYYYYCQSFTAVSDNISSIDLYTINSTGSPGVKICLADHAFTYRLNSDDSQCFATSSFITIPGDPYSGWFNVPIEADLMIGNTYYFCPTQLPYTSAIRYYMYLKNADVYGSGQEYVNAVPVNYDLTFRIYSDTPPIEDEKKNIIAQLLVLLSRLLQLLQADI